MLVTRIEASGKKYRVFVDGELAFILYKSELSSHSIKEGAEISQEIYEEIKERVVLKRAKKKALKLLEDMDRTEAQLRERLLQNGYLEETAKKAMEYVKSFGYINDSVYAKKFVEAKKGKKSRREIYASLCRRGLSRETIENAFRECFERGDSLEAIRTIARKRGYTPGAADEEEKRRLLAYLARKGFDLEEIRQAFHGF